MSEEASNCTDTPIDTSDKTVSDTDKDAKVPFFNDEIMDTSTENNENNNVSSDTADIITEEASDKPKSDKPKKKKGRPSKNGNKQDKEVKVKKEKPEKKKKEKPEKKKKKEKVTVYQSGNYCSVPDCHNSARPVQPGKKLHFHQFPLNEERRLLWQRTVGIRKPITSGMRICSEHFKPEDYVFCTKIFSKGRPNLQKDTVPSQKLPSIDRRSLPPLRKGKGKVKIKIEPESPPQSPPLPRRQRKLVIGGNTYEVAGTRSDDVSTILSPDDDMFPTEMFPCDDGVPQPPEVMQRIRKVFKTTKLRTSFNELRSDSVDIKPVVKEIKKTFLNKASQVSILVNKLEPIEIKTDGNAKVLLGLHSVSQLEKLNQTSEFFERNSEYFVLGRRCRIILTLMKINLNLSFVEIGELFRVSPVKCEKYFYHMVDILHKVLTPLIYWPPKEEILKNIPTFFKGNEKTRVVLDCFELDLEESKCQKCRIRTYSHYKGGYALKFMIGVSPSGLITFVSEGYGGRASDEEIFVDSDIISQMIPYNDSIMIKHGFQIEEECETYQISCVRPKVKLSTVKPNEMQGTVAAMVHIDRSLNRLRNFKMLNSPITPNLAPLMTQIMIICSALVNLSPPIIGGDKYK